MKPVVDSGAAIHVLSKLVRFLTTLCIQTVVTEQCWWRRVAVEGYVYRSLKFQVNYEVALVVRSILFVDVLSSKGVLVVFGEETVRSSS